MQVSFNVAPRFFNDTVIALVVYNADYGERTSYGNSAPFNTNQGFKYKDGYLTYTGERHPLWADYGWLVIAASQGVTREVGESDMAFMARVKKVRSVEYHTSMSAMHWYEVVDQTIARLGEKFVAANAETFMVVVLHGNSALYQTVRKHAPIFFQKTVFQLKKFGWAVTEEDWVLNPINPKAVKLLLDPEYQKLSGYRKERYQKWFLSK